MPCRVMRQSLADSPISKCRFKHVNPLASHHQGHSPWNLQCHCQCHRHTQHGALLKKACIIFSQMPMEKKTDLGGNTLTVKWKDWTQKYFHLQGCSLSFPQIVHANTFQLVANQKWDQGHWIINCPKFITNEFCGHFDLFTFWWNYLCLVFLVRIS